MTPEILVVVNLPVKKPNKYINVKMQKKKTKFKREKRTDPNEGWGLPELPDPEL